MCFCRHSYILYIYSLVVLHIVVNAMPTVSEKEPKRNSDILYITKDVLPTLVYYLHKSRIKKKDLFDLGKRIQMTAQNKMSKGLHF